MTVLLVNGSLHRNGGTARSLGMVEEELRQRNIETTWFQIGTKPVRGCIACQQCARTNRCRFDDDKCNEMIEKMLQCDGMIIGSPVYFAGPNGALLALLDRAFYATCNYGQLMASLDRLNKYFLFRQMPIAASDYWPVSWNSGHDSYAAGILKTLGKNYADLLCKLREKK